MRSLWTTWAKATSDKLEANLKTTQDNWAINLTTKLYLYQAQLNNVRAAWINLELWYEVDMPYCQKFAMLTIICHADNLQVVVEQLYYNASRNAARDRDGWHHVAKSKWTKIDTRQKCKSIMGVVATWFGDSWTLRKQEPPWDQLEPTWDKLGANLKLYLQQLIKKFKKFNICIHALYLYHFMYKWS